MWLQWYDTVLSFSFNVVILKRMVCHDETLIVSNLNNFNDLLYVHTRLHAITTCFV